MKVWLCELKILPAQRLFFLIVYDEKVHPDELLFTLEDNTIPLIAGATDTVKEIAERVLAKRIDDFEILEDLADVPELLRRLPQDLLTFSEQTYQGVSFLYDALEAIDEPDHFNLRDCLCDLCIRAIESKISKLSVSEREKAVSQVLEAVARVMMRVKLFW